MAFARGGKLVVRHSNEAVSGGAVTTMTVLPATATKAHGATQQYTVTAVGPYGAAVPMDAADIAWTVSNVAAGTISATGLFTAGVADADYQVRATHTPSTVYDEATVTVAA